MFDFDAQFHELQSASLRREAVTADSDTSVIMTTRIK